MSMLLAAHVAGAAIGLGAGAAALAFRKGSNRHRHSGHVFLLAVLVMAVSAIPLAYVAGGTMDMLSGMLVCYLVLTSWSTFRQCDRWMEVGLSLMGVVTLAGYLYVEWEAARTGIRRPNVPAGAGYVFATVIGLAIIGDGCRILGWSTARPHQIVRHLWRMCFALFMATVSFFLSRAHLFPEAVRESGALYLFALAPFLLMTFWWVRIHVRSKLLLRQTVGI